MKKNTSTHISRPKALLLMALLVILSPATLRAQETTTVQIGNGYNTYTSQYRSITFPESDTDDGEPYDGRNDIQIHIHIMNDIQPWSGEGTEQDPYIISSTENWNYFCNCLQDNATYNRFIGKTVRLANDIEVTRMAGSSTHDFMGTFDGQGHTLTIAYGTAESPLTEDYAAPFRNLENGANIHSLNVEGHIYTSNKFAGGIAGNQWGTVTISNCRSSVIIHSSIEGDGTHGGIVANKHGGALTMSGCVYDGRLLTTNGTTHCGGLIGWRYGTITLSDCLYAPSTDVTLTDGETYINDGATPSYTFEAKTTDDASRFKLVFQTNR